MPIISHLCLWASLTFALPVSFFLFWSSDGVSESRSKLSTLADLSQMMVFAAEPWAGRAVCILPNSRTHTHKPFTYRTHTHRASPFEVTYSLQHTYMKTVTPHKHNPLPCIRNVDGTEQVQPVCQHLLWWVEHTKSTSRVVRWIVEWPLENMESV